MKRISIIVFLLIMTHCCMSFAAIFPYTLNYQGMLTNNTGQPINGPQEITVSLYTTPIGVELPFWTETLSKVPVSNGQLSITLGTVTTLDPSKLDGNTYLGIKVGAQAEMLPRQKMTSVPYAFNAVNAISASNGIPKGGVIMWSGTVDQIPEGWALCDGVERIMSNGNKVTPPNLKDRFVVGVGDRFGNGKPKDLTGGEEEHVLNANEMPSHTHTQNVHTHTQDAHSHTVPADGGTDNNSGPYLRYDTGHSGNPSTSSVTATNQNTIATNQNTGGGAAHNNLPPYYALAFIMKL